MEPSPAKHHGGGSRLPPADRTLDQDTDKARLTLLAAMVDSSDDAIFSTSIDGTILSWNTAAQKIYGYSEAEVLGKSFLILTHPERPEEVNEILERISNGTRIEHFETLRVRKDK
ncbi:MAG TPA: PAS domain S-box protein, partial [Oligoflexus sp.]|uniref:PAS domain-containing protein n=1 Tax=Oligoflexus sp. TaxID=1971216 RepID=UPI002D22C5C1